MNKPHINEIVKGKVCGTFIVLAYGTIAGEDGVWLKEVHPVTHETAPGELFLTFDAIVRQ